MPPPVILDPVQAASAPLVADLQRIQELLPHRYEFQLLHGVTWEDQEEGVYAGFHDVCEDAWWTRGHIPGRPLLPGVLMIEVAAQLVTYMAVTESKAEGFLGFVGVDGVKFRGTVTPPARLVMVGKRKSFTRRRAMANMQGFVGSTMVFEGEVTGMAV